LLIQYPLWIVDIGSVAWGNVFCALLQDAYDHLRDKVQLRIWCTSGHTADHSTTEHLFDVINAREDIQRSTLMRY
jgi:glycerol-3-phosphate dehydrogenase (NAD+)